MTTTALRGNSQLPVPMDPRQGRPPLDAQQGRFIQGQAGFTLGAAHPHAKVLDAAFELSQILDCGLEREQIAVLLGLLETGVSPDALATVVKELRREAKAYADMKQ